MLFPIVGLAMPITAGCSSVSICLQQEKGYLQAKDARSKGCVAESATAVKHRAMNGGLDGARTAVNGYGTQ